VVDAERKIVFWNRAAEELSGYAARDAVGKRCTDLLGHTTILGESLCHDGTCPLLRCMRTDIGGTVPHIILMNTASGKPLPISLSVGPLRDHAGESIGAIAIFRGMREEYQQRKLAVEIQRRTITQGGFARNGVRVETLHVPLDEIGGDFLEAFFLDDHTLIATLADATGHGISASLFTMVYKTLLHSSFARSRDPGTVLEIVNRGFLESTGVDGFYIGACVVSYDTRTRVGSYAAAGHPRGLLFARDGDGYRLRETVGVQSLMLGMDEGARFREVGFRLEPGDLFLASSDGILEAIRGDGSQFGVRGVEQFFAHYAGAAPLSDLMAEVRLRTASRPLGDDVSALLLTPA
jgi:PAS domain S-box-containing protein